MYSYVEPVIGLPDDIEPEKLREIYDVLVAAFKNQPGNGIADKEYNAFIDRMLLGEANHVEEYQAMSDVQKASVQVIKRALKRIEARGLKAKDE